MARTTILEEKTWSFAYFDMYGAFCYVHVFNESNSVFPFVLGDEVIVVWDDEEYKVTVGDSSSVVPGTIYVGNGTAFELPGNGEPFAIAWDSTGATFCSTVDTTANSHTVAIYQEEDSGEETPEYDSNDVIIKRYSGERQVYENVNLVYLTHASGEGKVPFSYGRAVENVPIALDLADGDQTIVADEGILVKSAIIAKPADLSPENVRYGKEIAGVTGEFLGDTEEITVDLAMASDDQIITPSTEGKVISQVTIRKPADLLPENIVKDKNIGGVIGIFEGTGGGGENLEAEIIMGTLSGDYYNSKVTELKAGAFSKFYSLTGAFFPNCKSIAVYAFDYCSSLASISFPMCESVAGYAFEYCSALTEVNFPACSRIGYSAFQYCINLSKVSLPVCESIGANAFRAASALSEISLPECLTIGDGAFQNCSTLSKAYLPKCSTVPIAAFSGCYSLSQVVFLPEVSSIGNNAFSNCSALTEVSFPNCTNIGNSAFQCCKSLSTVYFPLVSSIGSMAFSSCVYGMKSVNFDSVKSIGTAAFWNINGWNRLDSTTFPVLQTVGSSAFDANYYLSYVYLPQAKSIYYNAFRRCTRLQTVSLPMCSYIYGSAFSSCSALMSLYLLGTTYASLANYAFAYTPLSNSTYTGEFGSIFVRESMLASYKTRAYWSAYSSRFVGLTDDEIAALEVPE